MTSTEFIFILVVAITFIEAQIALILAIYTKLKTDTAVTPIITVPDEPEEEDNLRAKIQKLEAMNEALNAETHADLQSRFANLMRQ